MKHTVIYDNDKVCVIGLNQFPILLIDWFDVPTAPDLEFIKKIGEWAKSKGGKNLGFVVDATRLSSTTDSSFFAEAANQMQNLRNLGFSAFSLICSKETLEQKQLWLMGNTIVIKSKQQVKSLTCNNMTEASDFIDAILGLKGAMQLNWDLVNAGMIATQRHNRWK